MALCGYSTVDCPIRETLIVPREPCLMTEPIDDHECPTAVVVVHGIGQQLPMDTLRSMADTLFGGDEVRPDPPEVYSKVDRSSSFLDLRRLSLARGEGRGKVDFYELYWAAAFGSGTVSGVMRWATGLLLRRNEGAQVRTIVRCARVAITFFVLLALGIALWGWAGGWWSRIVPLIPFLAALFLLPRLALRATLTEVLSDASRWFAPRPADITGRDKVRRLGLDLITELHGLDAKGRPRYGRIVVIGHSLGSVVAYDVLRLAFDQLREPAPYESVEAEPPVPVVAEPADCAPPVPVSERQPAAWHFEDERSRLTTADGGTGANVRAYQYVQAQLHAEQRAAGVPWRVTDLITVGSPLAHAPDLWRSRVAGFRRRVNENEFPACPPLGEQQHSESVRARVRNSVPVGAATTRIAFYRRSDDGPLIAHEASMFASTRWTNLYYPMQWWLGGDPVGGPVSPVFGPGVRDIPVRLSTPPKKRWQVLVVPRQGPHLVLETDARNDA